MPAVRSIEIPTSRCLRTYASDRPSEQHFRFGSVDNMRRTDMDVKRHFFGLITVGLALGFGCGGSGTRPEDMSAEAHRREAQKHQTQSFAHADQDDLDATRLNPSGGAASPNAELDFGVTDYNPTAIHRAEAELHQQHAEDHRRAAEQLERFEQAECGSFPVSTRPLCPLLGQVASVERLSNGVRIRFIEDANAEAIEAHARCHIAFAQTQGRKGMDPCPLYVKGVQVASEHAEPMSMDLVAEDTRAVKQVQQRTETHVHAATD